MICENLVWLFNFCRAEGGLSKVCICVFINDPYISQSTASYLAVRWRGRKSFRVHVALLSYAASVLVDMNLEFDPEVVVECISLGDFRICSKSNGCEVT
jgi:hypothetical protein